VHAIDASRLRDRRVSWRRLLAGGLAATVVAGLIGAALEFWRFGSSDEAASAKVERHVRREFDRMMADLSRVAARVASDPAAAAGLSRSAPDARQLFDLLDRRVSAEDTEQIASPSTTPAARPERGWAVLPTSPSATSGRFSSVNRLSVFD
jgi:hypothetical protein